MPIDLNDLRVQKTRHNLRQALLHLILRDGYDPITIAAITEQAQTARVTFYRHYHHKDELLRDLLSSVYADLSARTDRLTRENIQQGRTPLRALYDHLDAYTALYRLLFASSAAGVVSRHLHDHMQRTAIETMRAHNMPVLHAPLEVIAAQVVSSQLMMAIWWLENDKPYPVEYISTFSTWFTLHGLLPLIGMEPLPPVPPPAQPDPRTNR